MEERQKRLETFEKKKSDFLKKSAELKEKVSQAEKSNAENLTDLKKALQALDIEGEELKKAEDEMKKQDKVG